MCKTRIRPTEVASADDLEAELARIEALSLNELRARWRWMTERNAPKFLSRDLLGRIIAHDIQEQGSVGSAVKRASSSTGWRRAMTSPCGISRSGPCWYVNIKARCIR
jgi:hypothetical protein